jgi:fluoride exporter
MVSMMSAVAIGGFIGAISRYWLIQYIKSKISTAMPVATLTINLIGSFLLGLISGLHVSELVHLLFAVGFLGAFTTFSTLAVEAVQLWKQNKRIFYSYLLFSFGGGIAFAWIGYLTGNIG